MVNCAKIFSRDEILRIWKCPWSLQLTISTLQVYFCSPEVEVCIRTGIPSDPVIFYLFFFFICYFSLQETCWISWHDSVITHTGIILVISRLKFVP